MSDQLTRRAQLACEIFDTLFDCSAPLSYECTFVLAYLNRAILVGAKETVRPDSIGWGAKKLFEEFFDPGHEIWKYLGFTE